MKKKMSLKLQIVLILLVFIAIVLSVIYFFQTSLLDSFYKANKINYLENVAQEISNNIQNENLVNALDNLSFSNEVCIRIESNSIIGEYESGGACALSKLSNNDISSIYRAIIANGGKKLFNNVFFQYGNTFTQNIYLYGQIANVNNENILILVSTNIEPLQATIATISDQFKGIAVIVVVATIVLAILMATLILNPVNQIEMEAKNLPSGKYDKGVVKTDSLEIENLNYTLDSANEEIKKADKARKELIGNVSHDLRTPLTMIVGYGEMIRDLPEENNEENINVIIDEAKRLSTLVDDLLDLSKVESGKIELHKSDISLNELLTSVYRQYEQFCLSKNVDFKIDLGEDVIVNADKNRLKQVLYNFVNNALNYNDKENKILEIGVEKIDSKHRVYVYDNGQGIKEEDYDKIWDRYYKVDKEHKRVHLGSGIGLSLSKDILIASNLEYGVESKVGEYSKFYFDI